MLVFSSLNNKDFKISVAPMMDWTDRHCRYFHRRLSPHARLYTEMVTSAALVTISVYRRARGDSSRWK
jgi:tRNA-dihydrouridine synthase